jgi:hypothetical protein
MSEPFLSKILMLIDAKLLRNFAVGLRAKNFRGCTLLEALHFLPARRKNFTKIFTVSSINHLKDCQFLLTFEWKLEYRFELFLIACVPIIFEFI